jgi:ferredoxin
VPSSCLKLCQLGHDGRHPHTMLAIASHPKFEKVACTVHSILRTLISAESKLVPPRQRPLQLDVGFYCTAGRHRSFAAAELLASVLRQVLRADVHVIHHSASRRRCECHFCSGAISNATRDLAHTTAKGVWDKLGPITRVSSSC